MSEPETLVVTPALVVAQVAACRSLGPRGRLVTLDVPAEVAASYTAPGQYCEIRVGERTGYFAIASLPGEARLSFYVQDNGGSSTALLRCAAGASVRLGRPAGDGYRLGAALADGGPIVALATGSGWFGLRSALWAVAAAGRVASVYVGFRSAAEALDTAGAQALRDRGFSVAVCLSRPPDGWTGRRGYVQAALAEDGPDLREAWVLGCGQSEMLGAAREVCAGLGLLPGRFLTNY